MKPGAKPATGKGDHPDKPIELDAEDETSTRIMKGAKGVETLVTEDVIGPDQTLMKSAKGQKRSRADLENDGDLLMEKKVLVECPICSMRVAGTEINRHLDALHP